jgi:pimeloyl-ACP methyl ester carboxylesterase
MAAQSRMRSRFVMVNGIRTHYSELGEDGPVLIALHGGGAGTSGEAGFGPLAAELQSEFRIIALDSIGGYGQTDPSVPIKYGLQSRVDHFAAFADALCLDRFSIVGNSQGAWCAAKYATTFPDRVDKLTLIASASITKAMGIDTPPTDAMKTLHTYDGTREGMRRFLGAIVHDKANITDELIDRRQAVVNAPGVLEAFRNGVKTIRLLGEDPILSLGVDMRASLPVVTKNIPTIFVWGKDDTFALPSDGKQLEPMLPDVNFHWVDNAGHQVQSDQPALVAEYIRELTRAKTAVPA